MGLLVEATAISTAFLKVGIYGGPASGKTVTALKIATAIGKTAIIDTGREIEPLKHAFTNPDGTPFLVASTVRSNEVIEVIDECRTASVRCLILDNISTIWDEVQQAYLYAEYQKASKVWRHYAENGAIPFQSWKTIKKPYRQMLRRLLDAPLHVFILARQSIEYEIGAGGEPQRVGDKMDAERNTAYEPQVLIRMEWPKRQRDRIAIVERDRWRLIEGTQMRNPDVGLLKPVLAKLGDIHAPLPPSVVDAPINMGGPRPTGAQEKLLRVCAQRGGIPDGAIDAILPTLTPEVAGQLINEMTAGNYDRLRAYVTT